MNIFKGQKNIDIVEWCKITLSHPDDGLPNDPDKDHLIVQLQCKHGVVKTHKLHYQLSADMKAAYSKEAHRHKLVVPPKMFGELFIHFGSKLEEVTLKANVAEVQLKSFTEVGIPPAGNVNTHKTGRHMYLSSVQTHCG